MNNNYKTNLSVRPCLQMEHQKQGCHRQGKLDFKQVQGKFREFLSGQGISKSLFKVSEKSGNFILSLLQIILLDVFIY